MAYDRNDRRYGYSGDRNSGGYGGGYGGGDRGRSYGGQGYDRGDDDRARSYGDYGNYGGYSGSRDYRGDRFGSRGDYGQGRGGDYYGRGDQGGSDNDRGFFERAGDEVRSWFGDEDAERRRRMDERYGDRGYDNQGYGYRSGSSSGSSHDHDPSYRSWRDRQMQSLDRDYHEYRRENQSKFDTEFGSWRQQRQGQRDMLTKVQEHQEVVGSDGQHIGTVDHVRGDRIQLTKSDKDAGGHHHSIPCAWVQSVDDKVTVSKTADQAKQHWRDEQRNDEGGMFGRDNERSTNLNRSFSGTY